MAVGADPRRVVRMILGQATSTAMTGLAAGLVLALWTTRLVASLLYEVPARDPAAFSAAVIVIVAVTLLAGWVPGRRASRTDPADALRL